MFIKSFKNVLSRHHNNYKGWNTSRKIVVIESDDWGSICMPSLTIKKRLLQNNYEVNKFSYTAYDSLASEEDLNHLFSVLTDFQDRNGKQPAITANTVMTNPDFDRIRDSGYKEYFYELFTDTLKKYPAHERSYKIWKKGIKEKLFFPQFHGREHINTNVWLKALQDENSSCRSVFDKEVCYLGPSYHNDKRIIIRASYDTDHLEDIEDQKKIISEGLDLFKQLFGYPSKSFIANNFIYHPELNQTLYNEGVRYIQGMKYQKLPFLGLKKRQMIRHYQGERNKVGQYYLIRNCVFEPSQYPLHHDNIGECLKGLKNAFFWNKPAIISAHRLNFIGCIEPENRERNLKQFRQLLELILKKWPDVEFMTSVELGDLIASSDGSD